MDIKEMKKSITEMDVKSDEFFELYNHISDKYFDFGDKPDYWQEAMNMIHQWMNRSCNNFEEQVIVVAQVVKQVFEMRHAKQKACTGTLGFTDETFHFDIYTTEVEKDKMENLILKAGRQFGKNYFNKKKAQ